MIELRGIVLQYLQIKLKLHLLLFQPQTWYICDLSLCHIEIEGKDRWIIGGGGGPEGILAPSQIIGGGGGAGPLPPSPLFLRLCNKR